jgi:hypothetical protein
VTEHQEVHPIVPIEITQCEIHSHDGEAYISAPAIAEFLDLGRFSLMEDRQGWLVLNEPFLDRFRDPSFKSPCNPECFPFRVFMHVYVARFPYKFALNGQCCTPESGSTIICNRDRLTKKVLAILAQRAGEVIAYEDAVTEIQTTCSNCVLANRGVAVATLNAAVARDARLSKDGQEIHVKTITEAHQLPLGAQRTKRRISSFPGPVSALE